MLTRLRNLEAKFDADSQIDEIYELGNIIDEFEMAGDDVEQFDYAMGLLYDWADENDVWVKTF